MNLNELKKSLSKLPLGDIQYFDTIGSTNDEALAWAANDTPDLSVVIADEQTADADGWTGNGSHLKAQPWPSALSCAPLLRNDHISPGSWDWPRLPVADLCESVGWMPGSNGPMMC